MDEQDKQLVNATQPNTWEAVAKVVPQGTVVPQGAVVQAAIESCCGAANLADELIEHASWSIHLAHAGYVHRMKQTPDKTNFSDARL